MQFYGLKLHDNDQEQETASLGFKTKDNKIQEALQKMKDIING